MGCAMGLTRGWTMGLTMGCAIGFTIGWPIGWPIALTIGCARGWPIALIIGCAIALTTGCAIALIIGCAIAGPAIVAPALSAMLGVPNVRSGCGVAGSSASAVASLAFAPCCSGDAGFGFSFGCTDRKQWPQLNTLGAGGCCDGWGCEEEGEGEGEEGETGEAERGLEGSMAISWLPATAADEMD